MKSARATILNPGTHASRGHVIDSPTPTPPPAPSTTATRIQLRLLELDCTSVTDAPWEDEFYYVFVGVDGEGKPASGRGPTAAQSADADNATAWATDDSGDDSHLPVRATMFDQPLAPGQTAAFSIGFCESDGTDIQRIIKAAAALAESYKSNPYAVAAGAALNVVGDQAANQDDLLGGFNFVAHNDGGKVRVTTMDRGLFTTFRHPLDTSTGNFTLQLHHDGGDYTLAMQLRGI